MIGLLRMISISARAGITAGRCRQETGKEKSSKTKSSHRRIRKIVEQYMKEHGITAGRCRQETGKEKSSKTKSSHRRIRG